MKTIMIIILAVTLNAAAVLAGDYPVLDKDSHLVVRAIADGSAGEHSPFYVLLLPDHNPVIFKTFDSKDMERVIGNCLASGSILHYDPNPDIEVPAGRPTSAQIQSLADFCKKKGISLVVYDAKPPAAAWANDYHLVVTQLRSAPEHPVVYVLLDSFTNTFG